MRPSTNASFDRTSTIRNSGFNTNGGRALLLDPVEVDDCPVKDRSDRHSAKAKYRDRDRRHSRRDD